MKSSPVDINTSKDKILQIQIIWTNTIAKIEDNITGQTQFYWLEYKSQCWCNVIVSMLTLSAVDSEFEPRSGRASFWL
jgi:Flp pilus assembly CpaE family ATPase